MLSKSSVIKLLKVFNLSILVIGICLILINFFGLTTSYHISDVEKLESKFNFGSKLSYQKGLFQINQLNSTDSVVNFAEEVTEIVNHCLVHEWGARVGVDKFRVPFSKNYILWWLGRKIRYQKFEFSNWEVALERGAGLCSQHAIVVDGISSKFGQETKIVDLDGHVVTLILDVDGHWKIIDADYGVFINENYKDVILNPELITFYYQKEGYTDEIIQNLVQIYSASGNRIFEDTETYKGRSFELENRSYFLIWLLPVVMIIISITGIKVLAILS